MKPEIYEKARFYSKRKRDVERSMTMKMTRHFTSWAELPLILDIPQVACLLCLHPNTVTRLCRTGQLTGRKIGREWRVNRDSVKEFMNCKEATA